MILYVKKDSEKPNGNQPLMSCFAVDGTDIAGTTILRYRIKNITFAQNYLQPCKKRESYTRFDNLERATGVF